MLRDLILEARAKRAADDSQGDRDGHIRAVDPDLPDHVELGDRLAQLGIDDERKGSQNLVARGHGLRLANE